MRRCGYGAPGGIPHPKAASAGRGQLGAAGGREAAPPPPQSSGVQALGLAQGKAARSAVDGHVCPFASKFAELEPCVPRNSRARRSARCKGILFSDTPSRTRQAFIEMVDAIHAQ